MSTPTKSLKATCLCDAAAHTITLSSSSFPLKLSICHCNSCRHTTGTLCQGGAYLPTAYQPAPSLLERLRSFHFSNTITQYFCPQCGTHMLVRYQKRDQSFSGEATWAVATGTLESIEGVVEVARHIFVADTLDGGFADFLPDVNDQRIERWPQHPGKNQQLPLHWRDPERSKPGHAKHPNLLHAHCKCEGVSFYISRPSAASAEVTAEWPDVMIPEHHTGEKPPPAAWWLRGNGTKYLAGFCTCDSCRLAAGMEWVQWAFIPTTTISLDPAGRNPFPSETPFSFGTLKHYRSSEQASRYFCGTCGANVFWCGDERPGLIDVAVGLLDAAEGARAEDWLEWRTERVSYREDAVPRAESLIRGLEKGLKAYGIESKANTDA
ncbi:hypothetical protein D0859_03520 [Hortaea werneckii]|uniref:CENP-V/GFA domain-containing protein n=1 Tax=Hortaea werneckii TaxID=91943 RepID=A0A3M7J3R6_HORWE|nr:hypothetical protein D0859_03520 [Hortaea werneckii]